MKKSECAQNAKSGQAALIPVAESSQLQMAMTETNLTDDEIWRRFKKAQAELNQLIKEVKNEDKRIN
jgi:hypothetical protein